MALPLHAGILMLMEKYDLAATHPAFCEALTLEGRRMSRLIMEAKGETEIVKAQLRDALISLKALRDQVNGAYMSLEAKLK